MSDLQKEPLDVNLSKSQPSKANGLGGVQCGRSKSGLILKIHRFMTAPEAQQMPNLRFYRIPDFNGILLLADGLF